MAGKGKRLRALREKKPFLKINNQKYMNTSLINLILKKIYNNK